VLDLDETRQLLRRYDPYDTIGAIGIEALTELVAEVERLRAALEEVRATGDAWSAAIARDALDAPDAAQPDAGGVKSLNWQL